MKVIVIALGVLLASSCATPLPQTMPEPIDAFRGYTEALNAGDPRTAYTFLGKEFTTSMTLEAFERLYAKHGDAMKSEALRLLTRMMNTQPTHEAWFTLGPHQAHLMRTKDGWKMTGVLEASQETHENSEESNP